MTDADILAMALAEETVARRRLQAECNELRKQLETHQSSNGHQGAVTVLPDSMDTSEAQS